MKFFLFKMVTVVIFTHSLLEKWQAVLWDLTNQNRLGFLEGGLKVMATKTELFRQRVSGGVAAMYS